MGVECKKKLLAISGKKPKPLRVDASGRSERNV